MSLFLTNVYPGSYIVAFSKERGQLCAPRKILIAEGELTLDTAAQAGEHIWVEQSACGGPPVGSNVAEVQHVPDLAPPTLDHPLFWDRPNVIAHGCVPGATVQLYTREQGYISSAAADRKGEAKLPRLSAFAMILPGQHAHARQLLCDKISRFGPAEEVIDRTPLPPILVNPGAAAVGVPRRPHLTWSDPGKGTFREATKFLGLTDATITSFSAWRVHELVTVSDLQVGVDLPFGTKEIWRVTSALGDPGFEVTKVSAVGTFTVQSPAAPSNPTPGTLGISACSGCCGLRVPCLS